jgi:hypothetical protein
MPHIGFAARTDRGVGDKYAVKHDVVRGGAAHAERIPGLDDRHAFGVHRHAELQDGRPIYSTALNRAGHE